MIKDNLLSFGADQDISQVAGTYLAANQVPLSVARDIGVGKPMYLVIEVTEAIVGSGASVEFRLRSDSSVSVHATTSTPHGSTGAIGVANLAIGARFVITLPHEGSSPYEAFLGVQAIVSGATTTAGTYSAYLVMDVKAWKGYPDGAN